MQKKNKKESEQRIRRMSIMRSKSKSLLIMILAVCLIIGCALPVNVEAASKSKKNTWKNVDSITTTLVESDYSDQQDVYKLKVTKDYQVRFKINLTDVGDYPLNFVGFDIFDENYHYKTSMRIDEKTGVGYIYLDKGTYYYTCYAQNKDIYLDCHGVTNIKMKLDIAVRNITKLPSTIEVRSKYRDKNYIEIKFGVMSTYQNQSLLSGDRTEWQIATSKNMKKNKKSYTVAGSAIEFDRTDGIKPNKAYYLRARSYLKLHDGSYAYGPWSKVIKIDKAKKA